MSSVFYSQYVFFAFFLTHLRIKLMKNQPEMDYNSKGCLKKLNELFFTELFIRHNLIRFESGEVKVYRYEHETGLWT